MKKKKLKLKKKPFFILLGIIFLALISFIGVRGYNDYRYRQSIEYQLSLRGYSLEEIAILEEKLTEDILLGLVNTKKNNDLIALVREQYFMAKNMDRYLEFKDANRTKSNTDIVAIINVNADRYWYLEATETDISKEFGMLVNRFNFLAEDFRPNDIVRIPLQYAYEGHHIREGVLDAFIDMWRITNDLGLRMVIDFSFRSFEEQKNRYDALLDLHGRRRADELMVRPGFSEQQSGLALGIVRFNTPTAEFEETEEFAWLKENAHKYGFILRYPKGKEHITGFRYESSHWRFLGRELATKVYESGITFDEYYAFYLAG